MNPERWEKLDELFHSALERDGEARAAFVATACGSDDELLHELESMLAHHQQAKSFMESPAYAIEAESIVADDALPTLTGETFGSYQVLSQLGRGGMGEVYLAFDKELKRKVALKFLHCDLIGDKRRLRRFKQEARAASALNHPNILTVFEVGEIGGRQFLATEFVEGQTLREVMNLGQMKLGQVFDIAVQIASALSVAHAVGIIHRDIKPENIMLRDDGIVKVLDFGLAKVQTGSSAVDTQAATRRLLETAPGTVMGTVAYMSPEQVRGLEVDARSDIWSLGVVLYELVAGRKPFEGETSNHVSVAILEKEPPPLSESPRQVPAELHRIVHNALAKNPANRYQTTRDFKTDLKNLPRVLEAQSEPGQRANTVESKADHTEPGRQT